MTTEPVLQTVTIERDGRVLVMGLDRPDKRNAFDRTMLADLSRAYGLLGATETLRAGVLVAHGDHFTAEPAFSRRRAVHCCGESPLFPPTAAIPGGSTVRGPSRSSRRSRAGA